MGWGSGLILSKAQKSAATPTHPQLRAPSELKHPDNRLGAKSMAEQDPHCSVTRRHLPNALAQLIQHTGRLQRRIARLHGILITRFLSSKYSKYGKQQGYKPLSGRFHG